MTKEKSKRKKKNPACKKCGSTKLFIKTATFYKEKREVYEYCCGDCGTVHKNDEGFPADKFKMGLENG